jgi:hypothetical protein
MRAGVRLLAQAQGLVCHANYWVKCSAGEAGKWTPHWSHIWITVGLVVVGLYVLLKLFGVKA